MKNNFGYKMGYALGAVCVGCLTATVIALTIKLILWMF